MAETREPMPGQGNMPMEENMSRVVYWHENQLNITFHSNLDLSAGKERIIGSLNLASLNETLSGRGYYLRSFSEKDVSRPPSSDRNGDDDDDKQETDRKIGQTNNDLNSPTG